MLADPRSEALVANFTGQWLNVRALQASEPVVNLFPDFDDNLRDAFQREIELFFASIVHEDRSVLDLLTADYTFVNERLAKHYGIPNIYGPQFRRVTLPAGARHAPRPARQGRAADGDVGRGAHVAGDARQVVPADVPRRQPAGSAAGRAGDQERSRRTRPATPRRRRCGRRWKRTAPTRPAPPATRSSSRWASRSRTSTRSAPGGPTDEGTPDRRHRRASSTAPSVDGVGEPARRAGALLAISSCGS